MFVFIFPLNVPSALPRRNPRILRTTLFVSYYSQNKHSLFICVFRSHVSSRADTNGHTADDAAICLVQDLRTNIVFLINGVQAGTARACDVISAVTTPRSTELPFREPWQLITTWAQPYLGLPLLLSCRPLCWFILYFNSYLHIKEQKNK